LFGEAEVVGARKQLPGAVEAPGLQQLLGTDDAEQVRLLGADDVLPTGASGQREIARARMLATRVVGNERGVLVIRMCTGMQHTGRRLQSLQLPHQRSRALVIDRTYLGARRPGCHGDKHDYQL
jgi:hypothetical protein